MSESAETPVLNPAETEQWIQHVSTRIAKGVRVITDAEKEMKAKRRVFDRAWAHAMQQAEGPEYLRKAEATIETMQQREDSDDAELAFKYAQRTAAALERELFAAMAINRNIISMWGAAGVTG